MENPPEQIKNRFILFDWPNCSRDWMINELFVSQKLCNFTSYYCSEFLFCFCCHTSFLFYIFVWFRALCFVVCNRIECSCYDQIWPNQLNICSNWVNALNYALHISFGDKNTNFVIVVVVVDRWHQSLGGIYWNNFFPLS